MTHPQPNSAQHALKPHRATAHPRNLRLMLALWVFAIALCALVLWLMHLRGPALTP